MKSTLSNVWRVLALAAGVLVLAGTALAENGNGNGNGTPPAAPPGQEKKAEVTPPAAPPPAPAPAAAPAAQNAPSSAPGQVKKAEAPKPATPAKAQKQEAKAKKQEAKAEQHKARAADHAAKKSAHEAAKASQGNNEPARGKSAEAHRHVIVCHRTGSATNPYVVINISYRAWINGHQNHPPLDGRSDKLLKDHATPGEKGFDKSDCEATSPPPPPPPPPPAAPPTGSQLNTAACPTTGTRLERVLLGVWHKTGNSQAHEFVWITPNEASAHLDASKHPDDRAEYADQIVVVSTGEVCSTSTPTPPAAGTTVTVLSTSSGTTVTSSAPLGSFPAPIVADAAIIKEAAGAVAGVNATLPKAKKKDRGGVLGTTRTLGETAVRGRLPFTGLPLWTVVLAGGGLVAAGLLLRRRRFGYDRA